MNRKQRRTRERLRRQERQAGELVSVATTAFHAGVRHYWSTDSLRLAIAEARASGEENVARSLVDAVIFYAEQFRRLDASDPKSVAYSIHVKVDDAIAAKQAQSPLTPLIRCRSGCTACCKGEVAIWQHEANLLVEFAASIGEPIDIARLERQKGHTAADWSALAPEDRECVFLSPEGTCRAYEHRPTSCRKHFVATDPELCDTVKHPGGIVGRWVILEAETMQSGAMTAYPTENMAEMLLQVIASAVRPELQDDAPTAGSA